MKMQRRSCTAVALAGASILMLATAASAQENIYRLVAATSCQPAAACAGGSPITRGGESATAVGTGPGGTIIYKKTFFHPGARTYVTYDGQGDTHGGAALLMSCRVSTGGPFLPCEVAFGAATGGEWSTLNKVPTNAGVNNCGDGGGGTADCHDNTIHKEWCFHNNPGVHTVEIRLATDTPGSTVFLERSTVFIDGSGSGWDGSNSNLRCVAPGDPAPWPIP